MGVLENEQRLIGKTPKGREIVMGNIRESLEKAMEIDGAVGAALVDYESGMCLGTAGGGSINLELAAAGNTEVVRAKKNIRDRLGLKDKIEEILITLETQYHLIRMLHSNTSMFLYVVFDRKKTNLGWARFELQEIDKGLSV